MSLILNGLQLAGSIFRSNLSTRVITLRLFHASSIRLEAEEEEKPEQGNEEKLVDPKKDRRTVVPVEKSIKYLKSEAYKITYGDTPVWKLYRRNHKGLFPPKKTRKTCIRNGIISAGNPCPLCRDEYLVVDYLNADLLKQFISEYNGEIISYKKTGICQRKYNHLLVAIYKAKECGILTFDVPIRYYDYSEWKSTEIQA